MSRLASFKREIKMDPLRVQSGCHVRDQLGVEREARVELWSSLLLSGIAASLTITRATPDASASVYINVCVSWARPKQEGFGMFLRVS